MIFRTLFDFRFTRQGGAAIVRLLYNSAFVFLTIVLVGSIYAGIDGVRHALLFERVGHESVNYSMLLEGERIFPYWVAVLVLALPTYLGSLILNRLLAELCLAVLRIADATDSPGSR